jgi:bifunctional DNA-binding transcriptional regulator/antitoxin component of YhaV-PrlF toxin-antitoxin module
MTYLEIERDDNTQDLYITLPQEYLNQLGWEAGTEIVWEISEESITLRKYSEESEEESRETNITEGPEEDWDKFWYESESEGKEFRETLSQVYHSPEQQGSWS